MGTSNSTLLGPSVAKKAAESLAIGGAALVSSMRFAHVNVSAMTDARERWKVYKAAGHAMAYWQQTDSCWWEKKA